MKTRILIKNILFALVSIIFIVSAGAKFAGRETIFSLFYNCGMSDYFIRIALVQLIIVGCLLWKPLRSLGVLVASALLGGIIFMITTTGGSPLSATIVLIMLWVAYKLEWWGYWKHYDTNCHCGWCTNAKSETLTPRTCSCKKDICTC